MKVLFYAPYAGNWYLHTYWEGTIAHALRLRGAEVLFLGCDQTFQACDIFWSNSVRTEAGCTSCHKIGKDVFSGLALDHTWLGDRLGPEDYRDVRAWVDSLEDAQLFESSFDGKPLGLWCRASLIAHYKRADFGTLAGEHARTFRQYLTGAALALRSIHRTLEAEAPDLVVTLNGTFFSNRVALELALERGIRVMTHERSSMDETLVFNENATIWAYSRIEDLRDEWSEISLAPAQMQATEQYLQQRRYGKNMGWHSFSPPPKPSEDIYEKLGLDPGRPVVSLFTTSENEASQADWKGPLEQFEWIVETIRWFEQHPENQLVIRIHPNEDHAQGRNDGALARYRELSQKAPSNVTFIWPKDPVSSYSLIDLSNAILAYNSTVGAEAAAFRGIPVGVIGHPAYHGWGFTHNLETPDGYSALLERLLRTPPSLEVRVRAYRFIYRIYIWLSIPFPLVSVVNYSHGKLNYSSTNDLLPGREPNLDRIADGFLGRNPIYPAPAEVDRLRTIAEEAAWFANRPGVASEHSLPKVCVVAYIYNYAHYLDGAIQSILNQTYSNFELFILDDGSTDGTPELVKKYLKDPRVRYEYQKNKGRDRLHETFNRCLEATTGELIAIANGDDLMHPEKLERQVEAFLANPEVEIVYHGATFIDKDGAYFGEASFGTPFDETILGGRLLGRYLFEACHIPNPSVMFRRSILPRIGLQEYGWMHDYQFWLKAAVARCRFAYLPDKLLQYRIHGESHSTSSKRMSRIVEENRRMRQEMRPRFTIEDLYPEIEYCRNQEAARVSAYIDMGNRFAHCELPDMALDEYYAALALHPNHPVAINNAAICLLLTGEREEGIRQLRALAIDGPLEVVQRNLAEAERVSRLEDAKFHLLSEDSAQSELFQVVMPQGGAPRPEVFEASLLAVVDPSTSVEAIQQLLMSYLDAFPAESPQTLVLLISSPEQADIIGQTYAAACEALRLDPERTPLVSVQQAHPDQLASVFLGQLLSARAVVSLSDSGFSSTLMNLAQERGRLVLQRPAPEALIQAVGTEQALSTSSADSKREPQVVPYKFLLPYLESTAPARIEQALKGYLEAFAPDAARQLIIWLAPGKAPDEIAVMLDRACARLGKLPDEPFADVEVHMLPEPDDWDAEIVAFDALLDPGTLPPGLVAAARQSDLPLLTTFTAQAFLQASAGWEPAAIDIVLLTHDRLAYLKQTVDALFARTRHPFRLTIVDNASGPELQAYLDELRPRLHRLIRNSDNRWTEAFTQGIAITRSDPFIVSDPDIVVPQLEPCWLTRMLVLMAEHPEMGMVALNLDASNKPAKLPDVYVSEKSPYGPDLTLSYVGTVMQTIRRQYFAPPYTTDWHTVEAIRANGGLVGFANHLVGYHLGWNEDQDYPEHLVKKHQYFNGAYGSNLYKLYTQEDELLRAMDGLEPTHSSGLTSIVMLTWNQLAYTRLCIESVYNHTSEPFELILVDNGSTDGTVAYLEKLAAEHANIKLVLNATNRGYAEGNNQGLALAGGDTIVLLNNDTVVSRGWLSGLHKALQLEGVGVAGPRSNAVVGPQLVTSVSYDRVTLEGLEVFAQSWAVEHRDQYPEVNRIIGFCMAIRRDVLEQIGGLDTSFGIGNFEDDDYCLRVHLAGYKLVIAQEVFVHHFGSVTFKGQNIDYVRLTEANWEIFKEKYRLPDDLTLGQGYRHSEITARVFEPTELMVPIFSPDAPVAGLPEPKQFNIVLCDRDSERLKRVVSAYLEAFEPKADVALHVLAGTEVDRVHTAVLEVIETQGLQPDTIPDISLLDSPVNPLELSGYLRAGDLVIASPEIARGARDLGIPALVDPGAELLRVAHQEFGGFDWEVAALNLGERKPERWLLTADRWQEPLEGFLRSAEGTSSTSLYLRRPNEEATSLFEEISEWLLLKGFNPDQIPDIVVIDGALPSEVAVFRLATAWIETGDLRAKAMALALGLKVISLEALAHASS